MSLENTQPVSSPENHESQEQANSNPTLQKEAAAKAAVSRDADQFEQKIAKAEVETQTKGATDANAAGATLQIAPMGPPVGTPLMGGAAPDWFLKQEAAKQAMVSGASPDVQAESREARASTVLGWISAISPRLSGQRIDNFGLRQIGEPILSMGTSSMPRNIVFGGPKEEVYTVTAWNPLENTHMPLAFAVPRNCTQQQFQNALLQRTRNHTMQELVDDLDGQLVNWRRATQDSGPPGLRPTTHYEY